MKYHFVNVIDEGAYGVVFCAKVDDRLVAVKRFKDGD